MPRPALSVRARGSHAASPAACNATEKPAGFGQGGARLVRCLKKQSTRMTHHSIDSIILQLTYVVKRDSANDITITQDVYYSCNHARSILEGRPRYMLVSHPPGCSDLMVSVETVDSGCVGGEVVS